MFEKSIDEEGLWKKDKVPNYFTIFMSVRDIIMWYLPIIKFGRKIM